MAYLLQKCGIESAEVVGNVIKESGERDGTHAWNIIKIDGDYYYLDTTWMIALILYRRLKIPALALIISV